MDFLSEMYVCYVHSSRFVVVPLPQHDPSNPQSHNSRSVGVYEFSPYLVKRAQLGYPSAPDLVRSPSNFHEQNGGEEGEDAKVSSVLFGTQSFDRQRHPIFKDEMKFHLPCIRRKTSELFQYDRVMLDADGIIFVKVHLLFFFLKIVGC